MAIRNTRHENLRSYATMFSEYSKNYTEEAYDINQAILDEQFDFMGNVFEIKEESMSGSNIYTPILASINKVDNIKGKKVVSDDTKSLLFKNSQHEQRLGKRYEFDNNIWLTTNVATIKTLVKTSLIQRCNNTLKWYDYESREIYEEPCVLGQLTDEQGESQQHIELVDGKDTATIQYNEISKKIKLGQRFIINGSAYSVKLINKSRRTSTFDKDSVGNIVITLEIAEINKDTDDLENNIAYIEQEVINPDLLNGNIITPNVNELFALAPHNKQTYQVYNYINDIAQTDMFVFEFFDALSSKYKVSGITGNSFTIECLDFSSVPLVVSYRNVVTNETNEFTIKLSGVL